MRSLARRLPLGLLLCVVATVPTRIGMPRGAPMQFSATTRSAPAVGAKSLRQCTDGAYTTTGSA